MSAVGFSGQWFIVTCGTKLIAIDTKQTRKQFVFDCSSAEKKPKNTNPKDDNNSDCCEEQKGTDKILAFTVSPSGKLVALTDDMKRLVLLQCEPSWQCISIRWVARRCKSLVFSQAEDQLLAADKSGDVYSFSVVEPQKESELKMGHLSMLLAVTMSPDDRYIITADRDEKIRVSHLRCPYKIQSFCLGHEEFVTALLIPSGRSHCLLSGSGDGTVKLWEYESGCRLQSWNIKELEEKQGTEADKEKKRTVCRIASSHNGNHIAVQCERLSTVQFFTLDQEKGEERLVPHSRITLPHCPLDVTFDPKGQFWVLMDSSDMPLQLYTHTEGSWQCHAQSPELNKVTEAFKPHWDTVEASERTSHSFEHLHKVSFDNVTSYLQKKQQRLEEQQLKRTMAQKANSTKKAKKETQSSD
ncbi:hypothetical protein Q5P01_013127 [Channa striata]|uniref:WD repeat-containing protein 4 n=1 Tax=Channa striata TaxID=64152 RepID=A0AA88MIU3_CHASR|nr:hypothetical protein Q5P01_013127 [Channa striata]